MRRQWSFRVKVCRESIADKRFYRQQGFNLAMNPSDKNLSSGWLSRRAMLAQACNGAGMMALGHMLADDLLASADPINPLAIRATHHPRKAKHCIFMFMAGGVSQYETFSHKPLMKKYAGKPMPRLPNLRGELEGKSNFPYPVFPTKFGFGQHGQTGRWMCDLLPNLAGCVDDLAFIHGIEVDNNNHGPATLHMNTGSIFPGSPSVGSWIQYGLGSPNQNLPGYVVIQDPRGAPMNGAGVWGNGYLPASYQGTLFRSQGSPVINLKRPEGLTYDQQRREFDLLKSFNTRHLGPRRDTSDLEARINAYELAFRMQAEAPDIVDLSRETEATKRMYGMEDADTAGFGRQCLLARRLVEKGVRFTLLVHGVENKKYSWDDHGSINELHPQHCKEVDRPIAGLLRDLKQRGLLEDTLLVWASEMGRTPFVNNLPPSPKPGRDHNQYGLVMWMAGGGVKAGATIGKSDDFGLRAEEESIPLRDIHATILDLMGLDDNRLRYLHAGRMRQLTDIGGHVLDQIKA